MAAVFVAAAVRSAEAAPPDGGDMSISAEDRSAIERAIAEAETKTRGEIVCAVIEEASDYPEIALAWAAIVALSVPFALSAFGWAPDWPFGWAGWRAAHIGAGHSATSAALASYGLMQLVVFGALVVGIAPGPVRRRLTPHFIKQERVRRRAEEYFLARGLDKTSERTGVLIFASIKDRAAILIADQGIDIKVDARVWGEALEVLVAGMRTGEPIGGLLGAIERAARALAEHFPPRADDRDEISNALG